MAVSVYLYQLNSDDIRRSEAQLAEHLSTAEIHRVLGIKHLLTQQTVMMARIFLRRLLAQRLGCRPLRIAIDLGPNGKPLLSAAAHPEPLHFNVSHSGDCIMVAITNSSEVGIDIEKIKPRDGLDALAAYVMHPSELECYGRLTTPDNARYFFRSWVLKEAYVKYLGKGLQVGLQSVQTQVQPAAIVGVVSVAAENLQAPDGYCASVVFSAREAREAVLRQWQVGSVYEDLSALCG